MSDEIRELTNEETESIVGGARGSGDEPCTEHKVSQKSFPVRGKCTEEFKNCKYYSKSTKQKKPSDGTMCLEKCNLRGWENFSRIL